MSIVKWLSCASAAVLALASTVCAANHPETQFSEQFNQLLQQHQLPGAVVHIKHRGTTVLYRAYGSINTQADAPMHEQSIFRIFSMSKPITAVALLQLVERGLVDLTADIREYLPNLAPFEYNGQAQTITVHHLLSHTAGLGYGGGLKSWVDLRYLLANPLSRNNTLAQMLADINGIDLKYSPGSRFEYSIASDVQGAIIEAVSGQPLDQYLSQHIFKPLNMKDTGFYVPKSEQHRLVDMYEYDAGTFEKAYTFDQTHIQFIESGQKSDFLHKPRLLSGGGGLVSTAQDYANFVQMLLNQGNFNGSQILSRNLIKQMLSSHTAGLDTHFLPRVYQGVGFGYGIGVKETSGDLRTQGSFFWAGLGGTIFWADPSGELQVVVMFQVEDGWIALEKWMLTHVYNFIDKFKAHNSLG